MLSFRGVIISGVIFKSVPHFELFFVKPVRSVSRFIFLQVGVQLFQHRLLKILSLLPCIVFVPL